MLTCQDNSWPVWGPLPFRSAMKEGEAAAISMGMAGFSKLMGLPHWEQKREPFRMATPHREHHAGWVFMYRPWPTLPT